MKNISAKAYIKSPPAAIPCNQDNATGNAVLKPIKLNIAAIAPYTPNTTPNIFSPFGVLNFNGFENPTSARMNNDINNNIKLSE